jgi:hypothetical protein
MWDIPAFASIGHQFSLKIISAHAPLTARSNHMDILEEDKLTLMRMNSTRAKEIDVLKQLIHENGPELTAYRMRMIQKSFKERGKRITRLNYLGW